MDSTYKLNSVTEFPQTKKYENIESHPVQQIQDNKYLLEEELKMQSYSHAFGSHLPIKLTIERAVTSRAGRLPGLKSSHLGLEIAMNRLGKIDFEDFLGDIDPYASKEIPHLAVIKD